MNVKKIKSREVIIRSSFFCVFALLILFSFYDYDIHTHQKTEEAMMEQSSKDNMILKHAIEDRLHNVTRTLEAYALIAGNYDTLDDVRLADILRQSSEHMEVTSMTITTPDGVSRRSDGVSFHSAHQPFFQESMNGNTYISDVAAAQSGEDGFINISVPIIKQEVVIGVLHTSIDIADLKGYLEIRATTLKDFSGHLIQRDGTIVTPDQETITERNYFTYLQDKKFVEGHSLDDLKRSFEHQETGSYSYQSGQELRFVNYTAIEGTNWMVVTSLTEQDISTQVERNYSDLFLLEMKLVCIGAAFVIYLLYFNRRNIRQMRDMNEQMDAILAYTPGCIIRFCRDNLLDITFVNDEFFSISGYSKDDFYHEFHGDYRNLLYNDDREYYEVMLTAAYEVGKVYTLRYRIVHRDGHILWLYEKRHYVEEHHKAWLYVTLVDITELQTTQEKLRISENRFQLILEQTESVVFEWDLQNDQIDFSEIWEIKYGHPTHFDNFLDVLNNFDSQAPYVTLLQQLICGGEGGSCEIHLPTRANEKVWLKIVARGIKDHEGYLQTIIGSIENIDETKTNTMRLEEKSRMDGLTRLLNRTTLEQLINELFAKAADQPHVLFVIDVDDFKSINDTYGHVSGDETLCAISHTLRNCFRKSDYIGRIGGDEFVVLMCDVKGDIHQMIEAKLTLLQNQLKNLRYEQHNLCVTCSIGVAIYPEQGTTYHALFKHADTALYVAKNEGKDGYCLFNRKDS